VLDVVDAVGLECDGTPSIQMCEEFDAQGEDFRVVMRVRLGC
jgi:hypothetical protein